MTKKINHWWVLGGVSILPILISLITSIKSPIHIETDNDWIGFYGSYVGSILGVLGVFIVMRIDQLHRKAEKSDELFLKNIEIYEGISKAYKTGNLNLIKETIDTIRANNAWLLVDTKTKSDVDKTIKLMQKYNLQIGLHDMVTTYVYNNLSNFFLVNMSVYDESTEQEIEYQDTPQEIIFEVASILFKYINNSPYEEEQYLISISKEELMKELDEYKLTGLVSDTFDGLYDKVLAYNDSKELQNYINGRNGMYDYFNKMAQRIEQRIKDVLSY